MGDDELGGRRRARDRSAAEAAAGRLVAAVRAAGIPRAEVAVWEDETDDGSYLVVSLDVSPVDALQLATALETLNRS